jgi:dihydrolipoamide dehydrogenase
MAANDGPIPVRTLAHAARLLREARQLKSYGISVGDVSLDYPALLTRVRDVVKEAAAHSTLRSQIDEAGVSVHEHAGTIRFADAHAIEGENGFELRADRAIMCVGGMSRTLPIPGFEFTVTPADAFTLTAVPTSLLVIGAGATGVQVASIFNAFGTHIELFQAGKRIVPTEDEDVSLELARAFREDGIVVREDFGTIEGFEKTSAGVRMYFRKDGVLDSAEAELAVCATGWAADVAGLNLTVAGVAVNERGFIRVDEYLQTSAPHVFAAGDITGRLMLVPQAVREGYVAATNALGDERIAISGTVNPIGSFTDPEYAQVGLTEASAREKYAVLVSVARFDETTRPIIDGRTRGFCKLVIDRATSRMLGCHIVGERAVEVAQMAAIAMNAGTTIQDLARLPISFPTYANVLGRAALRAARQVPAGPSGNAPSS